MLIGSQRADTARVKIKKIDHSICADLLLDAVAVVIRASLLRRPKLAQPAAEPE
jgi:hypothetical protein